MSTPETLSTFSRGKFHSLTMVNWNGFFARTFELDALVTTLSGGNGAGKSTTMAAFIAALIPDLSLLHFRNTTEAGSQSGSRDKGLYGKLQRGHCYSLIEVDTSQGERVWFGVHLEQVANRDNKVNLTPFSVQGIRAGDTPTDLLLHRLDDGRGQVRSLGELKAVAQQDGLRFDRFGTVSDYHNFLFDTGVTPRKLKDQRDRIKFYRLIEASLYGGISSTISRSLKDYLLPENAGIRKAFSDMEAAIFENRRTLEAIRETQRQRDLFRQLITETTHYVAADYVRNSAEKKRLSEQALTARKALAEERRILAEERERLVYLADELERLAARERMLTEELDIASEHLARVLSGVKLSEKIAGYQQELDELEEKLAIQEETLAELQDEHDEAAAGKLAAEEEVDSLKSQLADYQQALDTQQTRAIQYRQARQALGEAKVRCGLPELTPEQAKAQELAHQQREQALTAVVLEQRQQLSLAEAARAQYDQALALLQAIDGEATRTSAYARAGQLLEQGREYQSLLARDGAIRRQLQDAEQAAEKRDKARALQDELARQGRPVQDNAELELQLAELDEQKSELEEQLADCAEDRRQLQSRLGQIAPRVSELRAAAPAWHKAQQQLERLRELSKLPLTDSNEVTAAMQQALRDEHQAEQSKQQALAAKQRLEQQIRSLSSGSDADPRLISLCEQLGGTLLADVYDDINVDDAPYYEALYGPARNGIVVADPQAALDQLQALESCPADVYLIQGNPDAFDEDLLHATELEGAIWVKNGERQLRYSRFPAEPMFGRAAREAKIAQLSTELEAVSARYAEAAFAQQKHSRLYHQLSDFVGQGMQQAFAPSPDEALAELAAQQDQLEEELAAIAGRLEQWQARRHQLREQQALLHKLLPLADLLTDDGQQQRLDSAREEMTQLEIARDFMAAHGQRLGRLAEQVQVLRQDPAGFEALQQQVSEVEAELSDARDRTYALTQLVARLPHLAYADAEQLLDQSSAMNDSLKAKLVQAIDARRKADLRAEQLSGRLTDALQARTALVTGRDARNSTLNEFREELSALGITLSADMEDKAREAKRSLESELVHTRGKRSQTEAQRQVSKREIESLSQRLGKDGQGYFAARRALVAHKASWARVARLAREHDVERRLARPELAYLDADELRSISDKALGALRMAVANDEELRDALRLSEGNRSTLQKVQFYILVFRHLKARIRHDIIRADDPVEALEEMEVELGRLADELQLREGQLSLSSVEVAAKINTIIRREQNRIRQLNQGLQNISFGLVAGVRLNVNIRDTYGRLLEALSDPEGRHQDLFSSKELSFSEAMGKLFQRLNPQLEQNDRSPQVLGQALLDYRNYLDLDIEVQRGADGWLRAESGALSTGEAIGTGQAILLMVLQSWEEESRHLRSREVQPCRLLFLDEAARLDARSIATLFELCERQDMQLLIAAPENISPEKGTTYKLIRKVHGKQEHVHVVGLRGFAGEPVA
ncbi:chromosome partition protein MukB [Zobellella maritima]|uniref:chromosome partition protein MukB n=1 Tax=Zobellella maritima TaxID=2059725 RepID=UPI001E2905DF|nr:chromosome partition protein MukB [Zobellella maritima]